MSTEAAFLIVYVAQILVCSVVFLIELRHQSLVIAEDILMALFVTFLPLVGFVVAFVVLDERHHIREMVAWRRKQ